MLFNQQQCFIYSTTNFLSKLREKKVEKLRILVIEQLQQMMAYRKFRKWNIGFRNREQLFPVLSIVKKNNLMSTDPRFFFTCDHKHTYFFFWPYSDLNWKISENKNAIPDLKRKIVKLIYIVHVVQGFKSASRIHEITVLTRTSGS